ncbi:DUF485 domain-containing protein [Kitasatospora sp. NPDC056446]|uniref:DUF485 domain-containing protein n=1 Tax=Kitasatospora sp. NPDC056446 TaxID=3345819 RepID=UPI00368C2227
MPQQQTSSPGQGQRFDWWAAPAATPAEASSGAPPEPSEPRRRTAVPPQSAPTRPAPAHTAPAGADRSAAVAAEPVPVVVVPVVVAPAAVPAAPSGPAVVPAAPAAPTAPAAPAAADSTEVYRSVQAGAAFQEIRRSYRTFVFPVTGVFLGWYLMYVAAQAAAPALMRTPVAGPFNVAWLLGLLQFASTFLLTWLYARNARTKRDRAALGLRWDTQDQLR